MSEELKLQKDKSNKEKGPKEESAPVSPNGRWTNDVLVQVNPKHTIYYLPVYVRYKVKNIEEMLFEGLKGKVSGVMLIDVYYGNMPENIINQFLRVKKIPDDDPDFTPMVMQVARGEIIELVQSLGITIKREKEKKLFNITVRRFFDCQLEGELKYSPFELINLYLCLTFQPVHFP